jgi:hypothetical protein
MARNRGRDIDESSSAESDEEENTHNSKENFSEEQGIEWSGDEFNHSNVSFLFPIL